ncbi:hypothetical protein C8J56DRAFT_977094 [Mycena floridula]|nr:hypothetical protein C8J56DRAFT_977094 [Mycena floridula]
MHVPGSSSLRPALEPFTYNKYHVSLGPTYPISQPEGMAEAKCIMAFQEMMAEAYIALREVWKEHKERFEELGELPENLNLYGPNEAQKNVEDWLAATGLIPKPEPGSNINSMLNELLAEAEAELTETSSDDNDASRPSASFRRFLLLRSLMLMSPERLWVGMQRTLKWPQLGRAIGRKTGLILRQSKSVLSLSSRSSRASSRTSSRIDELLQKTWRMTYLLIGRLEPSDDSQPAYRTLYLRHYLRDVGDSRHRKAFTRLICGEHCLAVTRLTWTDNHRVMVPYNERICRFCQNDIETVEHALLECQNEYLCDLRLQFLPRVYDLNPGCARFGPGVVSKDFLRWVISRESSSVIVAKYAYDVLKFYNAEPLFVPLEYRRGS